MHGGVNDWRGRVVRLLLLAWVMTGCGSGSSEPERDAGPSESEPPTQPTETFDVATWNLEWFGSAGNGPVDEALQLANVRRVIADADLDLWSVQEVVDEDHFAELLSGLPEYAGLLADDATVTLGPAFYRDYGTGRARGTMPIQLAGNIRHGGLFETAFGLTLGEISRVYDIPFSQAQFLISAYLFGLGLAQPFSGLLCDRFGRRPVLLGGFAGLLAASALLSVFSFVVSTLYIVLGAVDVGFNEAVLGAGVTGVLFLVAVYHTERRSLD